MLKSVENRDGRKLLIIVKYHYMRIWIYVNIWVFNNLLKTLLKTMLKVLNCWKNCWKIVENFLLYTETILILYRYQNDIKMISHYNACYSATNSSLWKVNRWFIRLDLPWHFGNVQKTKWPRPPLYALFSAFFTPLTGAETATGRVGKYRLCAG